MSWARLSTLALGFLGVFVFAGVAAAEITISGAGKGIERGQGDGIYVLQGTWTDSASGTNGTCLDPNDSTVHHVQFDLFNIGPPPFTEGFGTVDGAIGLLRATSAEAGTSSLFHDTFDFSVTLG